MKSAGSSAISRKATAHLKKVDPKMAEVIQKVGSYKGWPASEGSHFDAVARSIVFQQLSGKAAGTIHGRFQGLYGGRTPLPAELADHIGRTTARGWIVEAEISVPEGSRRSRNRG